MFFFRCAISIIILWLTACYMRYSQVIHTWPFKILMYGDIATMLLGVIVAAWICRISMVFKTFYVFQFFAIATMIMRTTTEYIIHRSISVRLSEKIYLINCVLIVLMTFVLATSELGIWLKVTRLEWSNKWISRGSVHVFCIGAAFIFLSQSMAFLGGAYDAGFIGAWGHAVAWMGDRWTAFVMGIGSFIAVWSSNSYLIWRRCIKNGKYCNKCNYCISNLNNGMCPECGTRF